MKNFVEGSIAVYGSTGYVASAASAGHGYGLHGCASSIVNGILLFFLPLVLMAIVIYKVAAIVMHPLSVRNLKRKCMKEANRKGVYDTNLIGVACRCKLAKKTLLRIRTLFNGQLDEGVQSKFYFLLSNLSCIENMCNDCDCTSLEQAKVALQRSVLCIVSMLPMLGEVSVFDTLAYIKVKLAGVLLSDGLHYVGSSLNIIYEELASSQLVSPSMYYCKVSRSTSSN
ncbi:MAG: hypothetical protein ACTJLM_01640 [Ehrlichia sp.]